MLYGKTCNKDNIVHDAAVMMLLNFANYFLFVPPGMCFFVKQSFRFQHILLQCLSHCLLSHP